VVGAVHVSRPFTAVTTPLVLGAQAALLALLVAAVISALLATRLSRLLQGTVDRMTARLALPAEDRGPLRFPVGESGEFAVLADALGEATEQSASRIRDLQTEQRYWEALFSTMRDGVMSIDAAARIVSINRAAAELLGLTAHSELVGRSLYAVLRNAELNAYVRDLLSDDGVVTANVTAGGVDSIERVLQVSGVRFHITTDADPGGLIVLRDVTRLQRLETLRTDFVANVSHELKTPLAALQGSLETLTDCIENDPAGASRFLAMLERQSHRMHAIIDDLLTLSRLEDEDAGVPGDAPTPGDLKTTIERAIAMCRPRIDARELTVDCDVAPLSLVARHRLLEQVYVNLVDNAAKYSPEHGTITIRADVSGDHVTVSVADEGVGIPRQHHERVFERFYRVDKSRDRQTGGTGLGLSIVKHIVRLHGGTVQLDTARSVGCCILVRLPLPASAPD
jgi:two-component system phosphate regulon sensor histidine kinase PhoR